MSMIPSGPMTPEERLEVERLAHDMTPERRIEIARRVHDEWWNWCAALEVRVELLMEKAGLTMDDKELAERIQALRNALDEAAEAGSTKPPPADRAAPTKE